MSHLIGPSAIGDKGPSLTIAVRMVVCFFILLGQVIAAEPAGIEGAVAYTDIVRVDYTKDGVRNQVQFWLEFKGRAAAGKPGEVGYQAAEGAVWYYLYDVEKKQKIANWLMGFNMMEGPPPSGPYPMTGLVITGNTARFEAFNMKWTVIDGGEGHNKDRVTIDDGVRQKDMRLYGGDLKVVSFPTQPSKKDEGCVRCHDGPAKDMFAKGGKHKELGCKRCHVGHPPAVKKPITPCVKCHQPHTSAMTAASCGSCHKAHTASVVNYVFNVSPQDCAACHKKASDDLYASKSKHAKLGCALCHPGKHKTVSSCLDCHGAPHPSHVMKNKEVCGNCHNTAHKTDSARLKK